jgi:hypothetical protein
LHPELYNASPEKSIERVRHGTPKPPRPAWNEGFPAGQQPRGLASGPQASGNGSNEDTVLKS